jgi:hypothetical protein
MPAFDPRQPDVLQWLASLPPEKELPARMALRAMSDYVRGDRAWNARIDALCAKLATVVSHRVV